MNNKGDVLAVLKDLASDQGMRALASAMLTASLTQGATELAELKKASDATTASEYLQRAAQESLVKGGVQAGVGTALYGGNLGQNLLTSLRSAAVDSLGEKAANEIGAAAARNDLDYVTHKIAHAALGGAMAAADGKDAASGAIGGVVGEITAQAFNKDLENKILTGRIEPKDIQSWVNLGVDLSKLAAGFAAAAAGGDVNTAAHTGGNAAQNNSATIALQLARMAGTAAFIAIMSKAEWKKAIEAAGNSLERLNEIIREKIQEYQRLQAADKTLTGENTPGRQTGTPLNPPDIKTGTELIPPTVDRPTVLVYPAENGVVPQLPGGTSIERDAKDYTTVTPIPNQRNPWDFIFLETTVNQLQQQINRGQAPKTVTRIDIDKNYGNGVDPVHIHFGDENALRRDGTWKHGGRELSNSEKNWLTKNGWQLPK